VSGFVDHFRALAAHPAFAELLRRLGSEAAGRSSLGGLTPTAKAAYLTLLADAIAQPLLVVVDSNRSAELLIERLETFHALLRTIRPAPPPLLVPALDALPGQGLSPHPDLKAQRAVALHRLATADCSIVVTPVAAALLRTEPAAAYRQLALTLRQGDEIAMDDLAAHLCAIGYEPREPVEHEGEFSIRGGIFDVFPAHAERPLRLEFWGDAIDTLRLFDVETQRSVEHTTDCTLLPLEETPRTRALLEEIAAKLNRDDIVPGETFAGWEFAVPIVRPRSASIEMLLDRPVVVWDEPESLVATADRLWKRLETLREQSPCPPEQLFRHWGELQAQHPDRRELELRELSLIGDIHAERSGLEIPTRPSPAFRNHMRAAVDEARRLVSEGYRVAFFTATQGELERLADIFNEYSLTFQTGLSTSGPELSVCLLQGLLRRGTIFGAGRLAIIGGEDLFETSDYAAEPARQRSRVALFTPESLDLKVGDYLVHAQHGIGKFTALRQIANPDGSIEEFIVVEYSGESKLYVPLTRLDLIQKYRGAGEGAPTLDRLGGVTWARTKSRVKAKMRDMAEELLKLYAARKNADGFPFSPDSNWQAEFEDSFDYTSTRDQLQATHEIKRDMESPHPMDRLLCGDVGFGKTEVAMRAAFKALGDGKQVAVLAPTTVLALQHWETFTKRFQAFPVRVEMVSRFRNPKEIKATLADMADGKVDVLIGTHRLLSKDVIFPDLGLLIVDEEQRFGVRHKERLKQLRQSVDVLTMSATPIPRTLNMSLLGLRDMSVIETPPKDRLAVQTVVAKFDPELVRTAIDLELQRGGRVYFVHNRVESIWTRAASIQELLPHARITVGHGQMGEDELEKVLLGFMHGEADVFVCTTIVENGLDIPSANTMIVENAQNYGLSELYQLRGRVGRSNRRAYAYLMVPPDTELTEIARKRLAALKEFSDLGAGFKIAALDLELRGAGNLLGGEQHGHIGSVGYETYVKLLDETARELRGEPAAPELHSALNLGLNIRIPNEYISDEQQRLRAYKRIADAGEPAKAATILAEFEDRYGKAPESVLQLVEFSQLKTLAARHGIESIERRGNALNIKFHSGAAIDPRKLMRLVSETPGAQFTPAGILRLPVPATGTAELLVLLRQRIADLAE
jgi:transcription-repair coupling factor (superfamily II helicase)